METKENNKNVLNDSDIILAKFNSMKIQTTADKPKISERPQIQSSLSEVRPLKSRQQLFPNSKSILSDRKSVKSTEKGLSIFSHLRNNSNSPKKQEKQELVFPTTDNVPSIFQRSRESVKKPRPVLDEIDSGIDTGALNIPHRVSPKNWMEEKPVIAETPLKTNDSGLFVTPQVKSFRVPSLRNESHKLSKQLLNKKAIDDFNPSQKVLFTTPGISRPPGCVSDNLSLSIEDTPVKTQEKLSPIKELRIAKKSSESLFPSVLSSDESPEKSEDESNVLVIKGNKYFVEDKLGSGGSSSVFLAKDRKNNRECAIKVSSFYPT